MGIFHKNITSVQGVHVAHSWEYADATARLAATGFTSADIHKLALQSDNNTLWMLTATTPTWVAVGQGTAGDKVKVSIADILDGYLSDKIIGTSNKITTTIATPAGNEQLQLGVGTDIYDKATDTMDDVPEGSTYGKVKTSSLTTGSVDHTKINNIGTHSHTTIDSHLDSTSNPHSVTQTQVGLSAVTNYAQLKRADGDFNSFTEKPLLTRADVLLIEDSATSFSKKKVFVSSLGGNWSIKNLTLTDSPYYITNREAVCFYCDATAGNIDIYLPTGDEYNGWLIMITKIEDSTNTVTILPQGGDNIIDESSVVLSTDDSGICVHRNTDGEWRVAGGDQRYNKEDMNSRLTNALTTGILTGAILTIHGDDNTAFDISDCYALFVNNTTDALHPTRTVVGYTGLSAIAATNLAGEVTYIALDINGNVIQNASEFTYAESRDYAIIGVLAHPSHAAITSAINITETAYSAPAALKDFVKAFGIFNIKGNTYAPNGANLNIDKDSGETYLLGSNYAVSNKVTSILTNNPGTALSFKYTRRDGSGGWVNGSTITAIDPVYYDDGTAALHELTGGKWSIQYIFYYPLGRTTTLQYGQGEFDSLDIAKTHVNDAFTINPQLSDSGVYTFRGYIIVLKEATHLDDPTEAQFFDAGRFGLATALSGSVSGEANTGSNIGTSGTGVFVQKLGIDLQFKNIAAVNNKVSITDIPATHIITVGINEGNIVHGNLSGVGTTSHANLDIHVASTSNPHSVTKAQVSLTNVTDDSQLKRASGDFASFTEKTTPVSGDILLIEDSAATNAKKRLQIGNISHSILGDVGTTSHANLDIHVVSTSNPHTVTKAQIGLTNVTDDVQVKASIGTAAGDMITFTGANTPVRVGIGTTGQALVVDLGLAGKVKWGTIDKTSIGLGSVTNGAQLLRASNDYTTFTEKTTLTTGDIILIEDSADTYTKKKITLSSLGGYFMTSVTGSYSYTNAGGEQTVIEIVSSIKKLMTGLILDVTAMIKNGTFRIYSKVDNTNYRLLSSHLFTVATDSDGILFDLALPVNRDLKITYQEATDEGADRAIPFAYILEG